ncbi:MAG TPA: HD domain-containing phosphohydrolase [Candidatus Acidoferrales bacterium]|nr:HD domain-containing phosphohydrolase [Candidatus Acidoferrales bacterium]
MPPTVLFVDSDPCCRTEWQVILQNHGYRVFTSESGKSAIQDCARIKPDLVLLNNSSPEVDGIRVCRQLKAAPLTRLTPVVLMLPSASSAEITRGMQAGADDFWGRPTSRWEALSRIQSLLRLKSYIDRQTESVILSLARSIEAKDPLTEGHSERLADYAVALGEALNFSADDLAVLRLGCLVHDIGKVAVPDAILLKPARLSPEEMAIVKQHPVTGEGICAPLQSFRDVLPTIRHHHERMDGTGYPDGLSGASIPLTARVVQVVDIYDALTTDRPYRKALPQEEALKILWDEALRGWLDRWLVARFTDLCQDSPAPFWRPRSMLADYYSAPRADIQERC